MLRDKEKAQLTPSEWDRWLGLSLGDVAEWLKALVSQISGDSGRRMRPRGFESHHLRPITASQLR